VAGLGDTAAVATPVMSVDIAALIRQRATVRDASTALPNVEVVQCRDAGRVGDVEDSVVPPWRALDNGVDAGDDDGHVVPEIEVARDGLVLVRAAPCQRVGEREQVDGGSAERV